MRHLALAALLLASSAVSVAAAEGRYTFRYVNSEGVTVRSDVLSGEALEHGYDVLDLQGNIVRSVEARLDDEEKARRREELVQKRITESESDSRDRYLLASFSTVEEIADRKERRLSIISREINQIERTIETNTSQYDKQRERAANIERAGGKVTEAITINMQQIRAAQEESENRLKSLQAEYDETAARFDAYIERFQYLRGDFAKLP